MNREQCIQRLKGNLIISCQAYEDNPLYGTKNMVTMAKCVLKGGATGVRACWPQNIKAIREVSDVPIIGINKIMEPGADTLRSVFITPTYESAVEVIKAGCDIVALDGTLRKRAKDSLEDIVAKLKQEYPDILLMADLATIEEGLACAKMGFDILSSTLSGYTAETADRDPLTPDLELIRALKQQTTCLINGEGRIWNLDQLNAVWEAGADMVTIGSAITNPMKTTCYLIHNMKRKEECERYV